MQTLIITFLVMLGFIAIMAVGVLFGRAPIKGSCGGVGQALGEKGYVCELCGNDPNKCEEETGRAAKAAASHANFYDAS